MANGGDQHPGGPRSRLAAWLDALARVVGWWQAIAVIGGLAVAGWIFLAAPKETSRWSLNPLNGCASGEIEAQQANGFLRTLRALDNDGIRTLTICADVTLEAELSGMPAALAQAFPGCVRFDAHDNTLGLVRNPGAVCRAGERLICKGQLDSATSAIRKADEVSLTDLPECG